MVLMGENPIATDTTSTVWTRLTTEDSWADYPTAAYDSFYCPKLANIAMIHYNDQLYAFGGRVKVSVRTFPLSADSTDQRIKALHGNLFQDMYSSLQNSLIYTTRQTATILML